MVGFRKSPIPKGRHELYEPRIELHLACLTHPRKPKLSEAKKITSDYSRPAGLSSSAVGCEQEHPGGTDQVNFE